MIIWIDGDACPREIREIVFKAAIRTQTTLKYIANSYHKIPKNNLFSFVIVSRFPDAADEHIVSNINKNDLVITSDLPLAYEAVVKKAHVINSRGEIYTDDNIRERLATRDLMHDLRSSGMISGGPAPFGVKDKNQFANALDKILQQTKAKEKSKNQENNN